MNSIIDYNLKISFILSIDTIMNVEFRKCLKARRFIERRLSEQHNMKKNRDLNFLLSKLCWDLGS